VHVNAVIIHVIMSPSATNNVASNFSLIWKWGNVLRHVFLFYFSVCFCVSVCRLFSIYTADILVLSILYGTKSDCCVAFIYNAWLPGNVCCKFYRFFLW